MARIKVTGYLDTDDLDPEDVDLDHEMGLSNKGYEEWTQFFGTLEDVEFQIVSPS